MHHPAPACPCFFQRKGEFHFRVQDPPHLQTGGLPGSLRQVGGLSLLEQIAHCKQFPLFDFCIGLPPGAVHIQAETVSLIKRVIAPQDHLFAVIWGRAHSEGSDIRIMHKMSGPDLFPCDRPVLLRHIRPDQRYETFPPGHKRSD